MDVAVMFVMLFLGVVGYIVVASIVSGWSLTYLWKWFVVPVFGVDELTIAQAIGISLIVSYLTYHMSEVSDDRTQKEKMTAVVSVSLKPLITLGVGYVVHLFV